MADLQERLNLQTKELQDALSQRKLAMSEYSEVSDKYVYGCFLLFLVDRIDFILNKYVSAHHNFDLVEFSVVYFHCLKEWLCL